jgi:hypothetical protein
MANDIVLGAPKAKGARTIPNPKGIHPQSDTDNPDLPKNVGKMDMSNPPQNSVVPKHPLEDVFTMTGIRHQPGHSVPKDHPAIQVSEN